MSTKRYRLSSTQIAVIEAMLNGCKMYKHVTYVTLENGPFPCRQRTFWSLYNAGLIKKFGKTPKQGNGQQYILTDIAKTYKP